MGKDNSKLAPSDMDELHHLTKFTTEELRLFFQDFKEEYPSGVLTMADFQQVYAKCFPFGDATKFSKHVFRQFDVNGDGDIDFREFVTALSLRNNGSPEERLGAAFSMYDLDNNGYISLSEMAEIVKSIFKMVGVKDEQKSKECVENIFAKMDGNQDGKLSITEFVNGTKNDPAIRKMLQVDSNDIIIDGMERGE